MNRIRRDVRRGMQIASLCGLASMLVFAFGAAAAERQSRLVDGSPAPPVPLPLRTLGAGVVMTKATVARADDVRPAMVGCPEARQAAGHSIAVVRVGAQTRSVTFRVGHRHLVVCDRDPRARPVHGPWCGFAAWDLAGARVSDPRLSLCYGHSGSAVDGFAWIDPLRRARWIVVEQPGYREAYATAGGLPVRVSTVSDLTLETAAFHVAQYDARGGLLVRRVVVAAIAG